MKVLVIGSNGRAGSALVNQLAEKNYTILAGSRYESVVSKIQNVTNVPFDLLWDVDEMAKVMEDGVEAVYFVSGSRGKNLLQVDLHGAVKTMQAAEKAGVRRYIMLSSIFALQVERWNESFLKDITEYNVAKHYADLNLTTQTKLNYTILQPGALTEETGSGRITVDIKAPAKNSVSNVVNTLVAILEVDKTIRKIVMMHDGDTPINEALNEVK